MGGDLVEVELGEDLSRAAATAHTLDDIDLGVGEHRHEVSRPRLWIARRPISPLERSLGELDVISARFPPRDAALHVGVAVVGAGGAHDTDGASRRESPGAYGVQAMVHVSLPSSCLRAH